MNPYQYSLLREAVREWRHGVPIPLDLYARMAQEGFDVPALEERYLKENNHG